MQISRRSFFGLVAAVPALAKMFPGVSLNGPGDERALVTIPSCITEIGSRRFATSRRKIEGPCRIYDILSSMGPRENATVGMFSVVRDNGATLIHWSQHDFATFRWIAAPASELVIPAGHAAILQNLDGAKEPDWITWTTFERPDPSGNYQIPELTPCDGQDNFEYDDDGEWPMDA